MTTPLPVFTQPPSGFAGRARYFLRERRFAFAGGLALAEAFYVIFFGPGMLAASVMALLILVACAIALSRLRRGVLSDVLTVVAMAQGFVLLVPMLLGFSVAIGLVVGAGIVVALVAAAMSGRR